MGDIWETVFRRIVEAGTQVSAGNQSWASADCLSSSLGYEFKPHSETSNLAARSVTLGNAR